MNKTCPILEFTRVILITAAAEVPQVASDYSHCHDYCAWYDKDAERCGLLPPTVEPPAQTSLIGFRANNDDDQTYGESEE